MQSIDKFEKIFRVFALALFAHGMFAAGAEFADNQVSNGVGSLIIAGLWLSFLLVEWFVRGRRLKKLERVANTSDDIFKTMRNVLESMEKRQDEEISKNLVDATKSVLGKSKPQKSHIPKIEKVFHEKMPGHWLKLSLAKNGKFDAEVSNEPFKKATRTKVKKAPAKKVSKK